ncbi:MAG: hypothetical protein AB7I48_24995 [Planctomycetaceae bacterium]
MRYQRPRGLAKPKDFPGISKLLAGGRKPEASNKGCLRSISTYH